MAHGRSTLVTWNWGPPFGADYSSDTSKLAKAGKRDAASVPDVRWRRGGVAAWRGGHVVGSSARASLSDLYGSSGRTGAAERETGRVSLRAPSYCRCHPTRRPARFQFYGAFVLFSPPAEVYGISPKGAGERVASGLTGCDLVSYRGAGAGVLLCGKRPGRSPERRAGPAPGAGSVAAAGAQAPGPASAQPPPARGGESRGRRNPGDVAGARRGRSGAPGGRRAGSGSATRCLRDRPDCAGVWLQFCRPFPAFEWPRGRAPLGTVEEAAASARTPPHLLFQQSGRPRR